MIKSQGSKELFLNELPHYLLSINNWFVYYLYKPIYLGWRRHFSEEKKMESWVGKAQETVHDRSRGWRRLWCFLFSFSFFYILASLAKLSDPLSVCLPFASYLHPICYLAQDNMVSFIIGNEWAQSSPCPT